MTNEAQGEQPRKRHLEVWSCGNCGELWKALNLANCPNCTAPMHRTNDRAARDAAPGAGAGAMKGPRKCPDCGLAVTNPWHKEHCHTHMREIEATLEARARWADEVARPALANVMNIGHNDDCLLCGFKDRDAQRALAAYPQPVQE